jgi:hypothetical protein
MQTVTVNNKIFTSYISAEEIQQANERLSKACQKTTEGKRDVEKQAKQGEGIDAKTTLFGH